MPVYSSAVRILPARFGPFDWRAVVRKGFYCAKGG